MTDQLFYDDETFGDDQGDEQHVVIRRKTLSEEYQEFMDELKKSESQGDTMPSLPMLPPPSMHDPEEGLPDGEPTDEIHSMGPACYRNKINWGCLALAGIYLGTILCGGYLITRCLI